ncbi:MAG: hypothetical protein N2509_08165 [Treponemataceae bacterium]|nr:hypothetical protein [Treponemataceae bacterium]
MIQELLRRALQEKMYRVYVTTGLPLLRRGILIGVPFGREDLGLAEVGFKVPRLIDYGDLILVNDILYVVVHERVFEDEWAWGPWHVIKHSLLYNGARYFDRCVHCGAEGPVDFYCKVCGAKGPVDFCHKVCGI